MFSKNYAPEPWFDEKFPKISEDSDLNFRLRQFGKKVFVDASIKVEHFARETLVDFLKLSFNYGMWGFVFPETQKKFCIEATHPSRLPSFQELSS